MGDPEHQKAFHNMGQQMRSGAHDHSHMIEVPNLHQMAERRHGASYSEIKEVSSSDVEFYDRHQLYCLYRTNEYGDRMVEVFWYVIRRDT